MDRRAFLKGCGIGATWLAAGKVRFLAAPWLNATQNVNHTFVLLFLRGGCDGLQLVAPYSDKYYQDARPDYLKASPRKGHRIDGEYQGTGFSFHPKAAALKRLYDGGDLAILHACGLTSGTRSHFDAMEQIERGIAEGEHPAPRDGWMARYLAAMPSGGLLPALSASNNKAAAQMGCHSAAAIPNLLEYNLVEGLGYPDFIREMYRGDDLMRPAAHQALDTLAFLDEGIKEADRRRLERLAGYPRDWRAESLSRSLQTVAQLIKMGAGMRMVNVDYDGWDTHEHQHHVFPDLVAGLSEALAAFYEDIRSKRDEVTVLVMSEFGRRLRPNKSQGTDHGHGNVMLALGGRVKGGRMYGDWKGLHPDALDRGVDVAVTTDYREVLSEVLKKSMQLKTTKDVFPAYNYQGGLGFL